MKEIKVFLKEGVRIWSQPLPAAYATVPNIETFDLKAEKHLFKKWRAGATGSDYDLYRNFKELARASNEMMMEIARRSGGEQSEVRAGNKQVFSMLGHAAWLKDRQNNAQRSAKLSRKPLVPPPQNDSEITNPEEILAGPPGVVDPKIHAEDVPE
jgi:hypothetical protein